MTPDEYWKLYQKETQKITDAELALSLLRKEYLKHAPFKRGDRVKILTWGRSQEVFVESVFLYMDVEFIYSFNKIKINGEPYFDTYCPKYTAIEKVTT